MESLNFFSKTTIQSSNIFMFGSIDDYEKYIRPVTTLIYGFPNDMSFEEICLLTDQIYDGQMPEYVVLIGTISGMLVLREQIINDGNNFYEICDSCSADMEYLASAIEELNDDPFNDISMYNIFSIDSIQIKEEYSSYLKTIFDSFPDSVQAGTNISPDMVTYFPAPHEYQQNIFFKIKHDMAEIANNEIMNNTSHEIYKFSLDEDQINYLLGRRIKSEAYPESAKDMVVWNLFSTAGFSELSDSRLLFRSYNQ